MKKKLFSLFAAIILITSIVTPAFAYDASTAANAPLLVDSEVLSFDGVKTRVDHYTQHGATITAYTFLDESLSQSSMEDTIETIKRVSDSSPATNVPMPASNDLPRPSGTYPFRKDSSRSESTDVRATISHHGTFYESNGLPAYIWIEGVQTEISFTDPFITPDIYVSRICRSTGSSVSLSISWPPGVSIGSSSDEYRFGSIGPISANFMTIDWDPVFSVSDTLAIDFSLSVISEVSFVVESEHASYSARITSTHEF